MKSARSSPASSTIGWPIEMKLDIDATVLYALGTRDVALFDNEVNSPYNTYLVAGLPPTPIASPGRVVTRGSRRS